MELVLAFRNQEISLKYHQDIRVKCRYSFSETRGEADIERSFGLELVVNPMLQSAMARPNSVTRVASVSDC